MEEQKRYLEERIAENSEKLKAFEPEDEEYGHIHDEILKDTRMLKDLTESENDYNLRCWNQNTKDAEVKQRYVELAGKLVAGAAIVAVSWFADDGRIYVKNIGNSVRDFLTFKP